MQFGSMSSGGRADVNGSADERLPIWVGMQVVKADGL